MMRAKFIVTKVTPWESCVGETLNFMAVTEKPYDEEGNSEDNTFARYTPTGHLEMSITNPSLIGKLKVGQKYYLDFTEAKE